MGESAVPPIPKKHHLGYPWVVTGFRTLALGAFATSLTLLGCQDATQITLDLRTDFPCADDGERAAFGSAAIYAVDASAVQSTAGLSAPNAITNRCLAGEPLSEIGTLALVPGGVEDDGRFGLRIHVGVGEQTGESCAQLACGDDACIDIRRRLSFVPKQHLRLPIVASQNCLGVCCPNPDETCVNGDCQPLDAEGCDPNEGPCDPLPTDPPVPPDPGPGLTPLWSRPFELDGVTVDIVAAELRESLNGPVIAIGGTYEASGPGGGPTFGDIELPLTPTSRRVFWATFEPFPDLTLTSITSCGGAGLSLRDLALNDDRVYALLQTDAQEAFRCTRHDSASGPPASEMTFTGYPWLATVDLSSADVPPILEPVFSLGPGVGAAGAYGVVVGSDGTVVSGSHDGGQDIPKLPSGSPISMSTSAGLWLVNRHGMMQATAGPYIEASAPEAHFVTRDEGNGTQWRLGIYTEQLDKILIATMGGAPDDMRRVSGEIGAYGRPRRIAGSRSVVMPIEITGQIDLGPDAPGAVAVRFNHNDASAPPLEAPFFIPNATQPHAGGTERNVCLSYVLASELFLECEGEDLKLSLGTSARMEAFDMNEISTPDDNAVDAALLVGQHTGALPGLGLTQDVTESTLYIALVGVPPR